MTDNKPYCTICENPLLIPEEQQSGVCGECEAAFRGWAAIEEGDGEDG